MFLFYPQRSKNIEKATIWFISILILASIAMFTQLGCRNDDEQKPPKLHRLNVGGHTTILSAPLEIALSKGFYKRYGLNVQIDRVESSKVSMAAMEGGDFDLVIGSLSAGSFNMIRKGDLVILADGSRVVPSIIVRKDLWMSEFTKLSDMKNRTIRTPREGSSSYYALSRILRGLGLSIDDVTPKYLGEQETLATLEAKHIDAAILNEPYATMAVEKGLGVRYDLKEIQKFFPPKGQQHMVLYTRRNFAEEKPELLRRFLKAYVEAAALYDRARSGEQPQRSEVVRIIAKYTGSEANTIEKSVWPYVSPTGKPDESYIKEMYDYFLNKGLVDSAVDLDKVIHLEFLPEDK